MISFPKNVFGAFGILFIISGLIIPSQNIIIWGPEFVVWFLTSSEVTAEKLSIGALPGGGDGFAGSMAAFEVFTSTERFPSNELRRLVIEDHQTMVRKMEKDIKVVE